LFLTFETSARLRHRRPFRSASAADQAREGRWLRVGLNLTACSSSLSYSGMAISKVQRQTRDAAIRLSTVDSRPTCTTGRSCSTAVERGSSASRRFQKRGFLPADVDLRWAHRSTTRYGHYHGDIVLRAVAHIIREALGPVDVTARYGGDEFVALLPETESSGA